MSECLFCKIIVRELPSTRVFENDDALAFLDIHPVNPGHTLLVPKKHCTMLTDADDETIANLGKLLKRVASAVIKGTGADGCNISVNNGAAAGQQVFHLHWHIIPRFSSDGLKLWPQKEYANNQREEVAEKIRTSFV